MEEQDPNRPLPGISMAGHSVAGQSLEESRPEEHRSPVAVFESSEGTGLQQGIGNTTIVHNYGNSTAPVCQTENSAASGRPTSARNDVMVGVAVFVLIGAVLIMGYLKSAPNIQSQSLPSIARGFIGREEEVDRTILYIIAKGKVMSDHPGPSVVNIVERRDLGSRHWQ